MIFGAICKHLGKVLHSLAEQKGCQILEGHLMLDHIHMCISIRTKYSVSHVIGFIKGKSAISIARRFMGKAKDLLCRWKFLGTRLFFIYSRIGWRDGWEIHPQPREGRRALRSAQTL